MLLAGNLAANDKAGAAVDIALLHVGAVAFTHRAQRDADQVSNVVHRTDIGQIRAAIIAANILLDQVEGGLRHRQVARSQRHHHPIAGKLEYLHFAKGGDIVHSRIGAGVGRKHDTGIKHRRCTIGHQKSSRCSGIAHPSTIMEVGNYAKLD